MEPGWVGAQRRKPWKEERLDGPQPWSGAFDEIGENVGTEANARLCLTDRGIGNRRLHVVYVKASSRKTKDGQVFPYLQLAHNEWDARAGV